ncbi:flagellin [Rhizorhapis suberifaciens]|uniref:Flagellin n=1 Tax=Rhizorhapis suberifaciens TaxID=13656 RepID=A0A840HWW8_9SPHN|nr:flagellin [Rhizorhapis suberifaciens]MBB4642443.1 flagellar hook-associated protein 3 FlgL [Rhizorhapis suberifaciens]
MVAISRQTVADEIKRQQALTQEIAKAQISVSSKKRLNAPSDDVHAWVEISEIGRMQSSYAAWTQNIGYGVSRSEKALTNLQQINSLMIQAKDLLLQASSSPTGDSGRAAIAEELKSVREAVAEMLNETDYQGIPVFDDTTTVKIPVGRGIQLEAVGTRQAIGEGIDVEGTAMTLDDILGSAITAVSTGDDADRETALKALGFGLDHVIQEQAKQGIRSERLSSIADRVQDIVLTLKERRSTLEDTDLTETIAKMQQNLLTLEAAQSAFARINRQSLFDLIS